MVAAFDMLMFTVDVSRVYEAWENNIKILNFEWEGTLVPGRKCVTLSFDFVCRFVHAYIRLLCISVILYNMYIVFVLFQKTLLE